MASLSHKQAAAKAKNAIQMYAKEDARWKTIGGPINILLVSKAGPHWIENQPPIQRWTCIQELVNEYLQGKFKFHLIPPATKQQLDSLMDTVVKSRWLTMQYSYILLKDAHAQVPSMTEKLDKFRDRRHNLEFPQKQDSVSSE